MITQNHIEKWRKNSIETAGEMKLFPGDVLDDLAKARIFIINDSPPEGAWYGRCFRYNVQTFLADSIIHSREARVGVYENGVGRFLPGQAGEIFNQSGMDHEIIGHAANYISYLPSQEKEACIAQKKMADFRANSDSGWKIYAKALPRILKFHRNVEV